MKALLLKFLLPLFLSIPFLFQKAQAQDLTGIWRGYFITDGNDQYKVEIQIEQSKQKGFSGVSYSYLTTQFYGKALVTGNFNATSKAVLLQEIKTVELRMSSGSVACIMKYLLQYVKSGREEFLEGVYTSKYEKTSNAEGIKQGDGCGGGKVFLRKVPTSDFYVEPFLREKPIVKKPASPSKPVTKANPPTTKKPIAKAPAKPNVKPPVTTKPAPQKPKTDTVKKTIPPPVAKVENKKPDPVPSIIIPQVTRSRENELVQTINLTTKEVIVRLYDNGEIDDDTISVYMDNKLVLQNKRLSTAPISLTLKLDNSMPEHVLVMVAENMGRIPPNTSLMIVQDGDKRYQVRITSTNQKNAMVRFRYQGSD